MGELPCITTSSFTTRSPHEIAPANRASRLDNLNHVICLTFVEANYEVLESLLRDRRRQIRNDEVHAELEYSSEEYDEEMEIDPRPAHANEATPIL
ncbi:hypothetical protein Tco_0932907 [Tanacetum coccineum]